ncbi:hypothetical protein GPJ56_002753 [Histomonas meleagridis]|uniref:uncharacterized protein n=1 Tax=Histomonas meleagridis TaxID=135588 RepID=UPI00355A313C|nr:hypothetical protein GPJ56_002753 [Histomonas meleagridis]KAH0800060.1 hypothetical protein GO595_007172 [Histomonas meleagridis]
MSVLSLFAPSATDQQYLAQLTKEITPRNSKDKCFQIKELFAKSNEITRKDLIPLLKKIESFLEQNAVDAAGEIASVLLTTKQTLFKESDFKQIMTIVLQNQGTQKSNFISPFLGLCEKSLNTESDVNSLLDDPLELVSFSSFTNDDLIISFIVRVAELTPRLRVPFVFAGLIEQILPTISTNEKHLSLLGSLISDQQARQYFIDMGHVSKFVKVLFDTGISNLSTSVFRSLLDSSDLIHLGLIQSQMFSLGIPKQLLISMTIQDSTDETAENAAICFGDCLKYYKLESLPFQMQILTGLLLARPKLTNSILYILENIANSNPSIFPTDEIILSNNEIQEKMIEFSLIVSYLSYEQKRVTKLDITKYKELKDHQLSLLLSCATQRKIYIEGADLIAQSPENEENRAIACANCIVTGKKGIQKNVCVHYAYQFFNSKRNKINPIAGGESNEFFPQSFLVWGNEYFNPTNIGRIINETNVFQISKTLICFDVSPDQSHECLLQMNNKAKDILYENDEIKTKFDNLKIQHNKLIKKYSKVEMELIECRCQQMKNVDEEQNE